MSSSIVKILPLMALAAALSACAHEEAVNQAPPMEMTELKWDDAVNLIYGGNVETAAQSHKGEVTLNMKNGDRFVTQTPKMDAILRVKKGCGAPCSDMMIAME